MSNLILFGIGSLVPSLLSLAALDGVEDIARGRSGGIGN